VEVEAVDRRKNEVKNELYWKFMLLVVFAIILLVHLDLHRELWTEFPNIKIFIIGEFGSQLVDLVFYTYTIKTLTTSNYKLNLCVRGLLFIV
jgi:hypothetical protein